MNKKNLSPMPLPNFRTHWLGLPKSITDKVNGMAMIGLDKWISTLFASEDHPEGF